MATKAELEAELTALKREHKELRENVVSVARDKAETHGWCSVIDEALKELGLVDSRRIKFTVVVDDLDKFVARAKSQGWLDDNLETRSDGSIDRWSAEAAFLYALEGEGDGDTECFTEDVTTEVLDA